MITCKQCGTQNPFGNLRCTKCGYELYKGVDPFAAYRNRESTSKDAFEKALRNIDQKHKAGVESAQALYLDRTGLIKSSIQVVIDKLGLVCEDWNTPAWTSFDGASIGVHISAGIRFGRATFSNFFGDWDVPAILPVLNQGNFFLIGRGAAKKTAVQALQSVVLRLTGTFDPTKLRLVFIDPVGLGANLAGFMHLPEIMRTKGWTEARHIEQQLVDITEHMEDVIQKYLRNDYPTMEAYNVDAGEVAEPYRFLIVVNFPANFTDDSAKRLLSIALNGPKAGVYTLATIDAELPLPYGFNLQDLLRTGSVVEAVEQERFSWGVPELNRLALTMDKPPVKELFNNIIQTVGDLAIKGDQVQVPMQRIAPSPEEWWVRDTTTGIRVPIGRGGARALQYFDLGKGTQHYALVAGKPGSGKSNLLHVLVVSLALAFPPEELTLYLVDLKKGVEFKDYGVYKLPHARVVGIESDPEFGLSVLREVRQEMNRRGDLFRASSVSDIESYREQTKVQLPRILLIIDEFQRLFADGDDALAQEVSSIFAHLTQQGRAFGVHLLLAAQALADAYQMGRSTYDKMSVRIALQCSDADSRVILGEDNGAARLLSRSGEAVYNSENGRIEKNSPFQVAWLPEGQRRQYLSKVNELARTRKFERDQPIIVFEGNVPIRILENPIFLSNDRPRSSTGTVKVELGASVVVDPPFTTAVLARQSRGNLLVLGQDEQRAVSIINSVLLSLALESPEDGTQIFIIDLSKAGQPWSGQCEAIAGAIPQQTKIGKVRDFPAFIEEVHRLLSERIADPTGKYADLFVVVVGLQRARHLRETVDKWGAPGEVNQRFLEICREGPELGIHVLSWCDTLGNFVTALERRTLDEFDNRVALQMATEDSTLFVESARASLLGQNRALFFDASSPDRTEKFRPYELPSDDEIRSICGARSPVDRVVTGGNGHE